MWGIFERFRRAQIDATQPRSPQLLGSWGERLAADFLPTQGYRLVATNFRAPIGFSLNGRQITGEIDIVAYDESSTPFTLAFIEVKTRSNDLLATPESAVDLRKQRQLVRTSNVYRRLMSVDQELLRYDVVSILSAPDRETELQLFRNYFSEQQFKHSRWLKG